MDPAAKIFLDSYAANLVSFMISLMANWCSYKIAEKKRIKIEKKLKRDAEIRNSIRNSLSIEDELKLIGVQALKAINYSGIEKIEKKIFFLFSDSEFQTNLAEWLKFWNQKESEIPQAKLEEQILRTLREFDPNQRKIELIKKEYFELITRYVIRNQALFNYLSALSSKKVHYKLDEIRQLLLTLIDQDHPISAFIRYKGESLSHSIEHAQNIADTDDPETNIVEISSQFMSGDYALSYVRSIIMLNKHISEKDYESASLYLSAMMNIRRGQGSFSKGIELFKLHNHKISISKLQIPYRIKVLKEIFAIAHESNKIDLANNVLKKIKSLDKSQSLHPLGDNWLPGVILWREAHLAQLQNKLSLPESIKIAYRAAEWFDSIKSKNTSGMASALLNLAWLLYLNNDEDCLDFFQTAEFLAREYSSKVLAEAKIGQGISQIQFRVNNWPMSIIQVVLNIDAIEKMDCVEKNYSFLGNNITPYKIIVSEIKKNKRKAFDLFYESIENGALPVDSILNGRLLRSVVFIADIDNRINKLIDKVKGT